MCKAMKVDVLYHWWMWAFHKGAESIHALKAAELRWLEEEEWIQKEKSREHAPGMRVRA